MQELVWMCLTVLLLIRQIIMLLKYTMLYLFHVKYTMQFFICICCTYACERSQSKDNNKGED